MKKMKKWLIAATMFMALASVSGCTSLNPLDILTDKPSLEVNANVGENVEQEQNTIKLEQGNTEQKADKISNDTHYEADVVNQVTQNIPMEYLAIVILLAGWLIPTPRECYEGIKWLVVDILDVAVKRPIKGIFNFVLLLFGRDRL